MTDTPIAEIATSGGHKLKMYVRYGCEIHPFPVPAVWDGAVWSLVRETKVAGIFKKQLRLRCTRQEGDAMLVLPCTDREFVAQSGLPGLNFITLVEAYTQSISPGGYVASEKHFVPLDQKMDLRGLPNYELERIWGRYMSLYEDALEGRGAAVRALPFAAPADWLQDLIGHLSVTPQKNITDNRSSQIELMRGEVVALLKSYREGVRFEQSDDF